MRGVRVWMDCYANERTYSTSIWHFSALTEEDLFIGNQILRRRRRRSLHWSLYRLHYRLHFDCTIGYTIGSSSGYSISYTIGYTIDYTIGSSIDYTIGSSIGYTISCTIGCTIGSSIGCTIGYTIGSLSLLSSNKLMINEERWWIVSLSSFTVYVMCVSWYRQKRMQYLIRMIQNKIVYSPFVYHIIYRITYNLRFSLFLFTSSSSLCCRLRHLPHATHYTWISTAANVTEHRLNNKNNVDNTQTVSSLPPATKANEYQQQ